jgi:diguanylate cyclase
MLMLTQLTLPTLGACPRAQIVERWYRLRLSGLLLAAASVGWVLGDLGASPLSWALLIATTVAWPALAREIALRGPDAERAEMRSLLVDSALGGMWIAMMQFNLLPSVLLTVMLTCTKTMAGGWGLAVRGLIVQIAACILALAVHGFAYAPYTTMAQIIASLPLVTLYPLAMGAILHTQARRLGEALSQVSPAELAGGDTELHPA